MTDPQDAPPPARSGLATPVGALTALLNIALPGYAYLWVLRHAQEIVASGQAGAGLVEGFSAYYILVLIFIFFMQIASAPHLPTAPRVLARDVGISVLLVGALSISGRDPDAFLFEMGALYATALMVAFFLLVWVRPLVEGWPRRWNRRQAGGYLLAAGAQSIFLVPGLAGGWLFTSIVLATPLQRGGTGWIEGAAYVAALALLTRAEIRWMRVESPPW